MHLLIGSSNAGKSTWIGRTHAQNLVFAFQVPDGDLPPRDAVLHYNLLLLAPAKVRTGEDLREYQLLEDPLLSRCVQSGQVTEATIIVAPIEQLLSRAGRRIVVEEELAEKTRYASDMWSSILRSVDHFAMYQQLCDVLEHHSIPYRILLNDEDTAGDMPEIDRCYLHAALRGVYLEPPGDADIDEVMTLPGVEYQSVRLPGGRTTDAAGFSHTAGLRRQSFEIFRDRSLTDASVLDIGCALGDILFWYERYGATRLTGIDLKKPRLTAASRLGEILRSRARFRYGDFTKLDDVEPHDDVLALNVLHHVPDIRGFLEKAAVLARGRLILEYPTLSDPKFQSLGATPDGLDDLPIIGVSSHSVDQTFVFTSRALCRIVSEFGDFRASMHPSPMAHREIAVFSRT